MRAWLGMRSRCGPGVGLGAIISLGLPLMGVCRVFPTLEQDLMLLRKDLKFGETGTWKLLLLAPEFITWLSDTLLICLKVGAHQPLTSSQTWDQIMEEDRNQVTWFKSEASDNSHPPSGFSCLPICLPVLVVLHALFTFMKHWCWDGC